jgi:thiol-disulfide isomerase/thioredoxin
MSRFTYQCIQVVGLVLFALVARADEHWQILRVGSNTYSNVTVTSVSATDIFFSHSRGMGNAKLKELEPALQKHFGYNASTAAAVEQAHAQAGAAFQQQLLRQPARRPVREEAQPSAPAASDDDFVAPQLYARSIRGQPAPDLVAERWLTDRPDTSGKFVLIDFWATWCGPCRRSIPELNEFSARFKDRLVVIGISDEPEAAIRKMSDPHIDYAVASDPQQRMSDTLQVKGIPHCILVDPHGIVRYEGMPTFLDDAKLQHFLDKYGR